MKDDKLQEAPAGIKIRPVTEAAKQPEPSEDDKKREAMRIQSISDRANLARSTGISEDLFHETPEVDPNTGERIYTVIGQRGPGFFSPPQKFGISSPAPAAPAPAPATSAVGVTPPPAPKDERQEQRKDDFLEFMKSQAARMGAQGAPSVKLNQDILQGIQGQQKALGEVVPVVEAQQPEKEKAYAGMQEAGQSYIDKLKTLQDQQAKLNEARRGEMLQEAAANKAAETSFDYNRILRRASDSPVSAGALGFAASLVGALKGAAGDMGPNQILGEVDKAVERDVANQREQYARMQYGQQTARTHFLDARQMGADEQKALESATIASLDQHKRALEFAEARVTDAKTKASLKSGIAALQEQLGGIRLKIDEKNASMAAAAANNRNAAMAQMAVAAQKMMSGDPEVRMKAMTHATTIMDKSFDEARAQAQAMSAVRNVMSKMSEADINEALSPKFKNAIIDGLRAAASSKNSKSAFMGALDSFVANKLAGTQSEDVNQLRAAIQNVINYNIKTDAGGSVTNQEEVRQALERTFQSPEGAKRWLDMQQDSARAALAPYQGLDKSGNEFDTVVQGRLDSALLPSVLGMNEWDHRNKTQQDWQAKAKQ